MSERLTIQAAATYKRTEWRIKVDDTWFYTHGLITESVPCDVCGRFPITTHIFFEEDLVRLLYVCQECVVGAMNK